MGVNYPEWGSSGGWQNLGTATEASATSEISLAVDDYDMLQVIYNVSCDASGGSGKYMSATINDVTADYRSVWSYSSGGAWTTNYNTGAAMLRLNGSDLWNYSTNNMFGEFTLFKPQTASMVDMVTVRAINGNIHSGGTNYMSTMFGSSTETDVSSIQLKVEGGNIQGSFTVNGLNF